MLLDHSSAKFATPDSSLCGRMEEVSKQINILSKRAIQTCLDGTELNYVYKEILMLLQ